MDDPSRKSGVEDDNATFPAITPTGASDHATVVEPSVDVSIGQATPVSLGSSMVSLDKPASSSPSPPATSRSPTVSMHSASQRSVTVIY